MIELRNLSFAYGKGRNAISDANGTINPGIHLLLGENGAGKPPFSIFWQDCGSLSRANA